jgi:hypothetical protein
MLLSSDFDAVKAAAEVAALISSGGMVLSERARFRILGIIHPDDLNEPFDRAAYDELRMAAVERWRLVHDICRRTYNFGFARGANRGHMRLPVEEDVEYSLRRRLGEARTALDRARFEVDHSDVESMSDVERAERANALVRLTNYRAALDGRRRRLWA